MVTPPSTLISLNQKFEQRISTASGEERLFIFKSEDSTELVITLLGETEKVKIPPSIIKDVIADSLEEIILTPLFPNPFIASAERTGAAIFRKELNFARNRLLEKISQTNLDPRTLLFKNYQNYALPVEKNVEFTRNLETISKQRSFIAEHYPYILTNFADLIGGEYTVTKDDVLYYVPKKGKRVKLSMDESSSAVRSLLDIGFYLKHGASVGDLLIVDEPELNLHPENQRRVARLFAPLVNLGIKVFITTHSDYIIKELNTLIMLNHDKPYLKRIAKEEGYQSEELIKSEKIKVYIAQKASIKVDGNSRKTQCNTLVAAKIDPEFGIDVPSFDTTINTMNQIQEAIVCLGRRVMSDIAILKEMLKESITVPLESSYGDKIIWSEPAPGNYSVTIRKIPKDDEVIVIKTDDFPSPKTVFANSRGECKRADFVIIVHTEQEKVIIYIEMKAGKGKTKEIKQQLQGSQCFVAYCREIGRVFWDKKDFLEGYKYRFVSIKNILINKKPTRINQKEIHDSPERMLIISSSKRLNFKVLVGKL